MRFWIALAAVCAGWFAAVPTFADPPPVEAYGKLPAVEQIKLSPSGDRYAFVAVVGDVRRLMVVTADGATRLFMTDVGDARLAGMDWVGDDHLMVSLVHTSTLGVGYLVSKGGSETVVVINVKTGSSFTVFDHHPDVGDIVVGHYGDANLGGHWYGYFGGITFRGDGSAWPDLYRVDLDSGAINMAAHGDASISGWLVAPDGKVVARTTHIGLTGAWQVRSGSYGGRVLASGASQIGDVELLGLGRRQTPSWSRVLRTVTVRSSRSFRCPALA